MTYSIKQTSVMLLAAGRGKRMLELTKNTPKPLLKIKQKSLIEHHLLSLTELGFKEIVINLGYLGEQIEQTLGDGSAYGLSIKYSDESDEILETAGGIRRALDLLSSDPFLVINADIYTDFLHNGQLKNFMRRLDKPARILMVDNPSHNQDGDFAIDPNGLAQLKAPNTTVATTFSGISLYHKSLFSNMNLEKKALAPVLHSLIETQNLEADHYKGEWTDVGTPERLAQLNKMYETLN